MMAKRDQERPPWCALGFQQLQRQCSASIQHSPIKVAQIVSLRETLLLVLIFILWPIWVEKHLDNHFSLPKEKLALEAWPRNHEQTQALEWVQVLIFKCLKTLVLHFQLNNTRPQNQVRDYGLVSTGAKAARERTSRIPHNLP